MAESVPKRGRRTAAAAEAGPALVGSVRNIPDDIFLFHILVLLPGKCLGRFESVCKLWRATIRSAPFVRRHMEASRAARPSSMALVPLKSQGYPTKTRAAGVNIFRFEPGAGGQQRKQVAELMLEKEVAGGFPVFSIPLHCDGLVLIPCTTGQVFVCNPTTGEFVELPPLTHVPSLDHRAALAFDPWSGTYKVGRPFIRSYRETEVDGRSTIAEYSVGHEILTIGGDPSGGSWSWKETMDPPYPIKPRTPICLPGVFYWSGVKSSKDHPGHTMDSDVILRFSLKDERFTVHPNPPCSDFLTACSLGLTSQTSQPFNSIFLSQKTSSSQNQPARNDHANRAKADKLMVPHGNCRRSCIPGECMARQQAQNARCLGPGGQILQQRMPQPHVALALPPRGQRAWQRGRQRPSETQCKQPVGAAVSPSSNPAVS